MLLDSSAWIEYLSGSEKGERVRSILEEDEVFTSVLSISEICLWCLRNNFDKDKIINLIEKCSKILNLNREIVLSAGKICFERKKTYKDFGMIDSLIYSSALVYSETVLTVDKHFSGLDGVEML